jgi:hypothetical protein
LIVLRKYVWYGIFIRNRDKLENNEKTILEKSDFIRKLNEYIKSYEDICGKGKFFPM